MQRLLDHPLSLESTFRIGGVAKELFLVDDREELVELLNNFYEERKKYFLFAGGSNILFSDNGISSPVIKISTGEVSDGEDLNSLVVDAGAPLALLVSSALARGLSGVEALSGIPGSVGGAIVGNAGAYGQSINDTLMSVEIWHRGRISILSKKECRFSYRSSVFKKELREAVILSALFLLKTAKREDLQKESARIIATRLLKYPPRLACPGSFFKNILVAEVPATVLKNIPKEKIIHGKIPAGLVSYTIVVVPSRPRGP
jgi:UDP-N-acetylmuramate dehydrogenase